MKRIYLAVIVGMLGLYSLTFWKNSRSYSFKSRNWCVVKSLVDSSLVMLAAFYLPALLVGWTVMWLTRGITRRSVQITASIILGIIFSTISGFALEILCVTSIFGIDLLTGKQGLYGWWTEGPPNDFMPGFVEGEAS